MTALAYAGNSSTPALPHSTRLNGSTKFTAECTYCGAHHWIEEKSSSSSALDPSFSCCNRGYIKLRPFRDAPSRLKALYQPDGRVHEEAIRSRHFLQNIRHFNNAFAFTSLGTKLDESVRRGRGPYVFKVNGAVHHLIGSMMPSTGEPRFLQINFIGGSSQDRLARRSEIHRNLDTSILEDLQSLIEEENPYMKIFMLAKDLLAENASNESNFSIRFKSANETPDPRTYNAPTVDEIAALYTYDYSTSANAIRRDLVIQSRGSGQLSRISETHRSYFPLRYPLLFFHGEDGWSPGMATSSEDDDNFHLEGPRKRKRRSEFVTLRAYLCYYFHFRIDSSLFHHSKSLFQEFVVDGGAILEQNQLNFIRFNQTKLRSELYSGLQDALRRDSVTNLRSVGRKIILPSSFPGSVRNMQQLYQDAIGLCRHYGRPDFFITMTCNPRWPVIQDNLRPSQDASDRPDIVARGFNLMFTEFMRTLTKDCVFGPVLAYCYTIEFQKRGLPHGHILLVIDKSYKLHTPEDVDRVISAEIPDPAVDKRLHDVVMSNLIHGPCGSINPASPCMVDGKCSKKYPWAFRDETSIDLDGYPLYRRRQVDYRLTRKGFPIDNRWVVPHNPYIAAKFGCHVNVEACRGVKAVKYIYKYIFKGRDRAEYAFENDITDEISEYIDARYLSPVEACWNVFPFKMHGIYPPIQRLQFHLPDQQNILFSENESITNLLSNENLRRTQLTEFFKTNASCRDLKLRGIQPLLDATMYFYHEFPTYYVWIAKDKKWIPRKRQTSVGRVYFADPRQGERYYLRLLLMNVEGATSFADLRTVRGVCHETFKEACLAYGLLENERHWVDTIQEASNFASGHKLRELFANILMMGQVSDHHSLFDEVLAHLSDDVEFHLQTRFDIPHPFQSQIQGYVLYDISQVLAGAGDSIQKYTLPPTGNGPWVSQVRPEGGSALFYETNYELDVAKVQRESDLLNMEQQSIKENVLKSVNGNLAECFFIDGPGGSGKTFLLNNILDCVRLDGHIALAVALSGIAATLLHGGRTAHSRFKLPLDTNETTVCSISKRSDLAVLMQRIEYDLFNVFLLTTV